MKNSPTRKTRSNKAVRDYYNTVSINTEITQWPLQPAVYERVGNNISAAQ